MRSSDVEGRQWKCIKLCIKNLNEILRILKRLSYKEKLPEIKNRKIKI